MAIIHDAYLFSLEKFASKVAPHLATVGTNKGYGQLRSEAIQLYESSSNIRDLLNDYGGWDRNSVLSQIPETSPYDSADVAFWFVILLYSEFQTILHELGLRADGRLVQRLTQFGWSDTDIRLLIRGNNFKDFAEKWFHKQPDNLDYWNYVQPFSTSSSAGWLDSTEVEYLLAKLNADEQKILRPTAEIAETDSAAVKRAFQSAMNMLVAAKKSGLGLCLIESG